MSIRVEFTCEVCDITMSTKSKAKHLRSKTHINKSTPSPTQLPPPPPPPPPMQLPTLLPPPPPLPLEETQETKEYPNGEVCLPEPIRAIASPEARPRMTEEEEIAIIDEWNSMQDELRRLRELQSAITTKLINLRVKKNKFKHIHGAFLQSERQKQSSE